MGLLGVIASGAAMGARDASNMNVQEANIDHREALRQHYETEKYNRMRGDAIQDAEMAGRANQNKYERDRADKLNDTEAKWAHEKGLLNEKEEGRNRRHANGIAARKSNGGSGGKEASNGIQLEDGSIFVPNDADSKAATNLVKIGFAENIQDAYRIVYAKQYSSQAASSIQGLTDGMVNTSKNMSGQLLQNKDQRNPQPRVYNPKTGKIE